MNQNPWDNDAFGQVSMSSMGDGRFMYSWDTIHQFPIGRRSLKLSFPRRRVFWLRPEHPLGDGAVGHAALVRDDLAGHSPCGRKSLPSANSKGAVLVPIIRCGHSAGQMVAGGPLLCR